MTTVVDDEETLSDDTKRFLKEIIEPNMCNIIFNADVVPRGYSELKFINDFVVAFLKDHHQLETSSESTFAHNKLASGFVKLHVNIFKKKGMMEQAERYRHVGKLIYDDNVNSHPVLYKDPGFFDFDDGQEDDKNIDIDDDDDDSAGQQHQHQEMNNFRTLRYGPQKHVADIAMENHMILVNGPGLAM